MWPQEDLAFPTEPDQHIHQCIVRRLEARDEVRERVAITQPLHDYRHAARIEVNLDTRTHLVERIVPGMQRPCGAIVPYMYFMPIELAHDGSAPLDSTSTPPFMCIVRHGSVVESIGEHSAGT